MSLLAMERNSNQNPDPLKPERVGHPEKLNQSLSVDVLEWYHPIVSVRQQKRGERVGHPPAARLIWVRVKSASANAREIALGLKKCAGVWPVRSKTVPARRVATKCVTTPRAER